MDTMGQADTVAIIPVVKLQSFILGFGFLNDWPGNWLE
jgi:hypothetical protein